MSRITIANMLCVYVRFLSNSNILFIVIFVNLVRSFLSLYVFRNELNVCSATHRPERVAYKLATRIYTKLCIFCRGAQPIELCKGRGDVCCAVQFLL